MTTSTIGTVALVSITIASASLALVTMPTQDGVSPELGIQWTPVLNGTTREPTGYTARVEHVLGADQVDATIAWNHSRTLVELERGDEIFIPCPTQATGAAFVVDDERGPWSTMLACHPGNPPGAPSASLPSSPSAPDPEPGGACTPPIADISAICSLTSHVRVVVQT